MGQEGAATGDGPAGDGPAGGAVAPPGPVLTEIDRALEVTIGELLDARAVTSSTCPSEAARALGGEDWRRLMEPTRDAARRMVARGEVEITQRGEVIDPAHIHGPIRIRRPR